MVLHSLFRFGVAFVGVDVCFALCDLEVRLKGYLVESVFVECHPLGAWYVLGGLKWIGSCAR